MKNLSVLLLLRVRTLGGHSTNLKKKLNKTRPVLDSSVIRSKR